MLVTSLKLDNGQFLVTNVAGENFTLILHTLPGERPFLSDYGNPLHDLIQSPLPLSSSAVSKIDQFDTVLRTYLPSNIAIDSYNVVSDGEQRVVDISVDFTVT